MGVDEIMKEAIQSFYIHNFDPEDAYKIVSTMSVQESIEPTPDRPIVSVLPVF